MDTLVLTQGYLPHRIVGWQKAILMSFTGKVEVVETYDELIRSVSTALPKPAVVRLTRAIKHREPKVRFSRVNVLTRDDFRCQYCGEQLPARELTFDHVKPRSQGGRTSWENIVSACRDCNGRKGNRTPEQAGMKLLSQPVRPKALPAGLPKLGVGRSLPDPWKDWVWWTTGPS
ncbi:MAG: HNH endonuclease [Myxococcota bacterium]|nr:HNH endonuclease [Myxococcota bacterium]